MKVDSDYQFQDFEQFVCSWRYFVGKCEIYGNFTLNRKDGLAAMEEYFV